MSPTSPQKTVALPILYQAKKKSPLPPTLYCYSKREEAAWPLLFLHNNNTSNIYAAAA